jgi:hypothetical protein
MFLMNKAIPKTMEGTRGGLEFLDISDNMPRQSETITIARRPPMPDAPLQENERELKVRVTPCQDDRRDEACVHTVDTTGILPTYDTEFAATTLANYSNMPVTHHDAEMHVDNTYKYETIYDEEVIATNDFTANNEEFVAATVASNNKETTADTLANYDEEFTIVTFAANNEETAAVEGEPWGA